LAEDIDRTALIIQERLFANGFTNIESILHENIDDVVPRHIELRVGKETVAFLFEPIACHNYNTITIQHKEINVATIDTMLSFYLAFIYANKPYFETDRILCMAQYLFEVEQRNRLEQRGLLKRFSIKCYGKQPTLETIRAEKSEKFKELQNDRNSKEWNAWFLKYSPKEDALLPVKKSKTRTIKKRQRKNKRRSIRKLFDLKNTGSFLY
jgi:hypothetical protein